MRVKFLNRDRTITAAKHEDIVTWMRVNDLEHYDDNINFMKAYAERKKLFEDKVIGVEDEEKFVKDLEIHKIIEVLPSRLFVSFKRGKH